MKYLEEDVKLAPSLMSLSTILQSSFKAMYHNQAMGQRGPDFLHYDPIVTGEPKPIAMQYLRRAI